MVLRGLKTIKNGINAGRDNDDQEEEEKVEDLASTALLAGEATKDKEGVTTSEANKPASQALKLQIKLKK